MAPASANTSAARPVRSSTLSTLAMRRSLYQGTWEGWAPLLASVWGRQPLPPRVGGYVLRARTSGGVVLPVSAVPAITRRTPELHHLEGFRLRLQSGGGRSMRFNVAPPRRDDEVGSFQQRRLERIYRRTTWSPRNAVYLESFYGRGATSVLAIPLRRSLARDLYKELAKSPAAETSDDGLNLTVGPLSIVLTGGRNGIFLLTGTVDVATLQRAGADLREGVQVVER